ncbi:unnamed protein product, partial [Pylaiella littoralis]
MAEGEEAVGTGMGDGDDGGSTAQTHYVGIESRLRARIAELEEENDVLALCATEVNRLTARVAELEKENKALSDANSRLVPQRSGGGG